MIINVKRNKRSDDGIFGIMTLDTNPFTCFTCENLKKSIENGEYAVKFNYSNMFKRTMPHIIVPKRDELAGGDAGIRIHVANYPHELEGCIAVGLSQVDNMVTNSKDTFAKLYDIIKDEKDLKIIVEG